ncbi:hypothetical protein HMPREF9413_4084 [Paenibacillus sp. HGF7]|nr:hypothetical protein HMPREF9413_4084 [Paenibacillus sp. HGF7]
MRQSALIIYYELLSAFSNLRDLYISRIIENKNPNPSQLFFSQEWVKNIAALRDKLSPLEITEVHKLYSRFHTLKFFLESESERANLDAYIIETAEKVFASFFSRRNAQKRFWKYHDISKQKI